MTKPITDHEMKDAVTKAALRRLCDGAHDADGARRRERDVAALHAIVEMLTDRITSNASDTDRREMVRWGYRYPSLEALRAEMQAEGALEDVE